MTLQNAFENLAVESKQDAAIAILTTINTAVADLDANTDGIEALLTTIASAVADLDANTDAIEAILTDIDTNTDGLEALAAAANVLLTDIDNNTDGIEALLTSINAAVADLDANTDGIEALITAGNAILTDIDLNTDGIESNQTNGTQKTQVVDGGGTVLDITATGAALVHLDGNAQLMDVAGWTQFVDSFVMAGGVISGSAFGGAAAIRSNSRAWLVEIVDQTGTRVGTTTNPINIASGYAEDSIHSSGDRGLFVMGVRNDADAVLTTADGEYSPLSTDSSGRVKTVVSSSALPSGAATEATQLNVLSAVGPSPALPKPLSGTIGTTATQLGSLAATRGVIIKADDDNTGLLFYGNANDVTSAGANGFEIGYGGSSVFLEIDNADLAWIVASVAGQGYSVSAV